MDVPHLSKKRSQGADISFLSLNPDQHQDLISYLERRGNRLQIIRGLELRNKTDLILIEANFSYFNIFRFLKRLQREQSTACVILMGPDLDAQRVSALLRGGVFDYLKIPFPLKRLGKVVQKGLRNRENFLKIMNLSNELESANRSLSEERDQLKKWNNDLTQLYELNQLLSRSLQIDEIVKSSIENIKKVVTYDIFCLYLKGWDHVRVEADMNKWDSMIEQFRKETRENGLEFIKNEGPISQAVVLHCGSEIIVSLAVGTNRVGLLRLIRRPDPSGIDQLETPDSNELESKGLFNEYQAKILSMISAPMAIAIRNAEMYKQVEELAVKDELTNVLNRRAFYGILDREFKRAHRYKSPMTLMVIDLDYFKKVNDTYGHLAGDQVLCEMASAFKSSLRDIDILIRYGGEEFVVILPGTNFHEGLIVANRIKDRVEKTQFYKKSQPVRMTVSIGVSHYPSPQIISPRDLFERADQALYTAKKNGRNRIMILKSVEESACGALALEK